MRFFQVYTQYILTDENVFNVLSRGTEDRRKWVREFRLALAVASERFLNRQHFFVIFILSRKSYS
jgi:hypothetical protein